MTYTGVRVGRSCAVRRHRSIDRHEFGTGLLFPAAGCWKVHVTLDQVTGDVYIVVR